MARALTRCGTAAFLALALADPAAGAAWRSNQDSGTLQFTAVQAGARFTGEFRRFAVRLDFDPQDPARARLEVTVPTASVETLDADRDDILRSEDFFWSERHASAEFRAAGFARDGKGWSARGELTLRGVTRPVKVMFTLDAAATRLTMRGSSALRRLDFGVGQGEWKTTEWIGDEVGVRFDLVLRPDADGAPR